MLRVLCAVLVVALPAILAGAADAACREGARVTQSRAERSDVVRSTVRLCVGGRERTVLRASMRVRTDPSSRDPQPRSGTVFTAADARAGRLAIGSLHARRGRRVATVELRGLRRDRRLFRRAWRPARHVRSLTGPVVVLTADGDLAWSERPFGRRLFVRRTSGTIVRVRTRSVRNLAVEDGRTLRWGDEDRYEYFDVRPVPGPGCPARARFAPLADDGQVLVTRAAYGEDAYVLRACLRGTGRDVVLGGGAIISEDTSDIAPVLLRAPFVVVLEWHYGKYEGYSARLARVDLRNGAVTVLDDGQVTDVRAEGDTVHWKREGVDRSARV